MDGTAGSERLTTADLFVGLRNVPVRVVERHWQEEEGRPDSLLVFLSSGRDFTIRHGDTGQYRVSERDLEIDETDEQTITGLSRAVLNALGLEVWARFAEHQSEVA